MSSGPIYRFAQYEPGVAWSAGIRVAPSYPGERTGAAICSGEIFSVRSTSSFSHTHTDDKTYTIEFYELSDGRGWVHDFSDDALGQHFIKFVVRSSVSLFSFSPV
jgi:hypothetical protein